MSTAGQVVCGAVGAALVGVIVWESVHVLRRRRWERRMHEEMAAGRCPDGGTCHHGCYASDVSCYRVAYCGPLSGVFPNDRWPTT